MIYLYSTLLVNNREWRNLINSPHSDRPIKYLYDIHMSEDDIRTSIDKLPNSNSYSPDGIPAYLVKQCKEALVKPVSLL